MASPTVPFIECEQTHAGLAVSDIAAALEFYTKRLGFQQAFTWGEPPTFAGVNLGKVQMFLAAGTSTPSPDTGAVYFLVGDADALYEFHRRSGVETAQEIGDRPYGIRDYTVRVYVYGESLFPQAIFTSEPPLPQEEIISLLATGTTRQELSGSGSGNVLVGRAAMLVVQQLYRKIFKKGQPTQSNSVFDRLQVDVGTVDPRTGRRQATGRFKVNENWVLVGDVGVGGDFRGQVKYLIRFH